MAISSAKKSPRGRPRIGATPVNVRLAPEELAGLDAWIKRHPEPRPTRPEAFRRILAEHLAEHGLMRSRPDLRKPKIAPDAEPPRGNIQVAEAEAAKRKPVRG